MITILLHSSKTMKAPTSPQRVAQLPLLIEKTSALANELKTLSVHDIQTSMHVSAAMAEKTHRLIQGYDMHNATLPAIDSFLGDIYSGLQVQTFSEEDCQYANEHLRILSGLYGVLRALDSVQPYRLEMGYKLPTKHIQSLYKFWDRAIADTLPTGGLIINLSAVEYTKTVLPYLENTNVISPKFLTVHPKTKKPTFVTVHAKIARGAFARWLIQNRIQTAAELLQFNDLGYQYNKALSTPYEPMFVAETFQGLGLSVRLTK